jgi:hypothetical protein
VKFTANDSAGASGETLGMAGTSSHVEHRHPGATRDWRHASAGGANRHREVCLAAAFVDLTGDSSEDEQTVKRFSVTKQPVTTGKPQAAHRHSLGSLLCPSRGLVHSDDKDARRLSKDDKALDAFTASRRDNEDGKTVPQQSDGVKRSEDLPFLHKRSKGGVPPAVLPSPTRIVTQVPSAREKEGGPHGKRQAARAPKKAADAELARLKLACPGDKLKSPAGKRKRDQLGPSRTPLSPACSCPCACTTVTLVCK